MNTLSNKSIDSDTFLQQIEQEVLQGNSSLHTPVFLSKDTLLSLEQLGDVLRSIQKRMLSEGYEIVDGKINKKSI